MVFESTNPLTSRQRFKTRTFVNLVVIAGIFLVSVTLLSLLSTFVLRSGLGMFLFDLIVLLGAYYLYILWDKRAIRLMCGNCRRIILSNTPWVCGVCKRSNTNSIEFPFVHKCEHCGAEPKTYRCHNIKCGDLIFLTEDEDSTTYAFRLDSPLEVSKSAERSETVKSREEAIEDKEREIRLARREIILVELGERYDSIKKRMGKDKKPLREAKKESLNKYFDSFTAVDAAVREQKFVNAEECKNDRGEQKRRDAVVDAWAQRQMAGEEDDV